MALLEFTRHSPALGKQTQVHVALPDQLGKEPLKVLYLLHGLSDNNSCWNRNTRLERFTAGRNLAVVMPDGGKSFYENLPNEENYFDYISCELQDYVEKLLPFSGKAADRYIAGLSMGGYGALKFALTSPHRYAGAASFSGVTDIVYRVQQDTFHLGMIFPGLQVRPQAELFWLAGQAEKQPKKPKIYQWCGTEDYLYEDNLRFRDHMKRLQFDYTYSEGPGNHEWDSWEAQLKKILDFFAL